MMVNDADKSQSRNTYLTEHDMILHDYSNTDRTENSLFIALDSNVNYLLLSITKFV